jgi:hypothetical protein
VLFSVEIGELQFFRFLPEFSELLDSCISIGCFLNGQQVSDDVAWVDDLFSRSFLISCQDLQTGLCSTAVRRAKLCSYFPSTSYVHDTYTFFADCGGSKELHVESVEARNDGCRPFGFAA